VSGADCNATDVRIHLGKRPLVGGDDGSRLGRRRRRRRRRRRNGIISSK